MEGTPQLHKIDEVINNGDWIEEWAAAGVEDMEAYLAKHLAFLAFLETGPGPSEAAQSDSGD